ncbi:hypothetical protein GCM10011571_08650 [Marinithermofilum abyssi]|uniref:Uncharacterized protein n=1 Tax=Marinithermofilum abyssi TaxID=1571185 RepID=A0A8J2VDF3_9BACL|nr:hypothetical protein [Marinithermofilum abyssi]GGE09612.1 hypothetical protein GCM10011571_08650 [Marinithermofilum abyssi]
MVDWSVASLWEWQAMTILTLLSAGLAWWTKRRLFSVIALGGVTAIVLAVSLWEPFPLWFTVVGITLAGSLLLWITKMILEPTEEWAE